MKNKLSILLLLFVLGLAAIPACTKDEQVKGTADLKILASPISHKTTSDNTLDDLSVLNGTVQFSEILLNINSLAIEDNTGDMDEDQDGTKEDDKDGIEKDHQHGDQSELDDDDDDDADDKDSDEKGDVILPGPYLLNLTSSDVVVDQTNLPAGVYKQVSFFLAKSTVPEYTGLSGLLKGLYSSQGTITPFQIETNFEANFQYLIANGGLDLLANGMESITVAFNVAQWFNNLDLAAATLYDGTILIDPSHNVEAYSTFIKNLSEHIDLEDE